MKTQVELEAEIARLTEKVKRLEQQCAATDKLVDQGTKEEERLEQENLRLTERLKLVDLTLSNLYFYAADACDELGDEGVRDAWQSREFKSVLTAVKALLPPDAKTKYE